MHENELVNELVRPYMGLNKRLRYFPRDATKMSTIIYLEFIIDSLTMNGKYFLYLWYYVCSDQNTRTHDKFCITK